MAARSGYQKAMSICTAFFIFISFSTFSQKSSIKIFETGTTASFRGLSVVDDKTFWAAGTDGTVCRSINEGASTECKTIESCEQCDFRSVYAFDQKKAIVANAGSPAIIFITLDGGNTWKTVYENKHPDAFFDGIGFWNQNDGIIYGDPINGKMLLLKTSDGGLTWQELPDASRPQLFAGEASYAASGTGIKCMGSNTVIVATGGLKSRLIISEDKGISWRFIATPVIQESASTGIFSFDFLNDRIGIIAGGDYKAQQQTTNHVFYTINGGEKWVKPVQATRGYRECVQYITASKILAAGPSGIDESSDGGMNWYPFSDARDYHTLRKARNGTNVFIAGSNGKLGMILKMSSK